MFGVWKRSFSGVRSVWKGSEVSYQPMSSTMNSRMFGRRVAVAGTKAVRAVNVVSKGFFIVYNRNT